MNNNYAPTRCRKHTIWSALLVMLLAVACVSSCSNDYLLIFDEDRDDGEEKTLPISLLIEPLVSKDPETRAMTYEPTTADEKKIADFWIIEYNEYGTRVGKPRYYKIFDVHVPDVIPEDNVTNPASADVVSPSDVEWTESESGDAISSNKLNILVPREGQGDFTCVVIANTHNDNLFNASNRSKFSTLDSLRNCDMDIHNQHDLFNPDNKSLEFPERYLPMSGWTKISRETRKLNIKLIRNVCKVHVKLLKFTDKLVFKYYQWRNVPFSQLFPHGTNANYTQAVSRDWIQHSEPGRLGELKEGIDFWLPCNVWLPENDYMPGSGSATGSDNIKRKEDATYFDIACSGADPGGLIGNKDIYEFTLYPSMEVGKQFDFEANHYYKMEVDINDIPKDNPFFKSLDYIHLPESNCYMVKRDSKGVYAVPIYRINRYWANNFYEFIGDPEDQMIKDDTEWVAEVIWQDTPLRIFDFAVTGDEDAADARDKFEGIGAGTVVLGNDGYPVWDDEIGGDKVNSKFFAFRTTGTGVGNVLIGVRKKITGDLPPVEEREYLWSWHIWITDYNPDAFDKNTSWGDIQVQKVPGGELHRLFAHLDDLIPGKGYGYADWDEDVYIMDRNLGATSAATPPYTAVEYDIPPADEVIQRLATFGLFYQYARKDPFPFPSVLYQGVYDIKGQLIPVFNSHEKIPLPGGAEETRNPATANMLIALDYGDHPEIGTYVKSVHQPYKFFCRLAPGVGWCQTEDGKEIDFKFDQNWGSSEDFLLGDGKSIYDPCPPGWTVADGSSFGFLSDDYEITTRSSDDDMQKTDFQCLQDWVVFNRVMGFYLIGKDPDLHAWFPTMGKRYGDTGGGMLFEGGKDNDANSAIWTKGGVAFRYNHGDMRVATGANREDYSSGCAIRCMRNRSY